MNVKRIYIYILSHFIRIAEKKHEALLREFSGEVHGPARDRLLAPNLIEEMFQLDAEKWCAWLDNGRLKPKKYCEMTGRHLFCPVDVLEVIMMDKFGPTDTNIDPEKMIIIDIADLAKIWRPKQDG